MVTYRQLHDLRLGALKKAVTDWKDVVDGLIELVGEDGHGQGTTAAGLAKKAGGADWAGNNADVTKKFVTKTAAEFQDALATAKSVHTTLNGLYTEMKAHKDALEDIVANADKGIHVTANGTVEPRDDADPKPTQQKIDAVADDIKKVLKAAAETDKGAAEALRHEAKDKYNFLSSRITDFEKTRQAVKDAEAVLRLATKDPGELSNTQLERLNDWLKRSGKDPVFAERVATELGPKKSLTFFAKAMDLDSWSADGHGAGSQAVEARKRLLGELETGLGTTLATASRSESTDMETWKKGALGLGDQLLTGTAHHKPVYGFQAMSNLMRHGTYDGAFLNEYGDALVAYEKKHTGDVKDPGPGGKTRKNVLPWDSLPSYAQHSQLHFGPGSDKDAGLDPMTGFMKALSRNPDASSDFFSSKEPQNNAEWTLQQRPSFSDVVADGFGESKDDYRGPSAAMNATGDALVAGATGLDPANPHGAVEHTPQQKAVLESAVHHLAARKDDFPAELRDDMAKILVNHGDQVHYTAAALADDPSPTEQQEYADAGLSDAPSERRLLDRRELLEVAKQVSRDQDSYHLLNDGLHREMVHDIQHGHPKNPLQTLVRAGHTVGFLEEARYQAIGDEAAQEKRDIAWKQTFAYHGAGTVISFMPEAHVAGIMDREAYLLSYKWKQEEEDRVTEGTHRQNGEVFRGRENQLQALAEAWRRANPDAPLDTYDAASRAGTYASQGNATAQGLAGRQPQ
ncbi:hypothetical protein [Streptomyces albus]|uniref:hypothetical protein n=1 Tax=Streptomyces albus TaxID=1888 RepID=UPI0034518023